MVFRASYTVAKKLQVIECFETHNNKETALLFGINKSMVSKWTRQADDLAKRPKKSLRYGSGRRAFFPEIEKEIYQESLNKRKQSN
jgi:transposase-like protein